MVAGSIRKAQKENAIERIVDAFHLTLVDKGPAKLSLDAVAQKAGMSKGAIIHHFKTRSDLEEYVLRQAIGDFTECVRQNRGEDTTPGAWTRAYVRAMLAEELRDSRYDIARLMVASPGSESLRTVMLEPMSKLVHFVENDGLDLQTARMIIFAADGVWWAESTGASIFADHADRETYIETLIHMTM